MWANWAGEELLEDVPHRQVVFTIPERLRVFFRYDRKLLGEQLLCRIGPAYEQATDWHTRHPPVEALGSLYFIVAVPSQVARTFPSGHSSASW